MNNKTTDEIFNFPCAYPIKIFGKDQPQFKQTICAIIERHTDKLKPAQISKRHSSKNNYIAFTMRIIASSRTQIDAINADLKACPLVAYIL